MGRKTKGLTARAAELLTEEGYLNAMAELEMKLASGECTRDQTSGLIGARRCLESFQQARQDRELRRQHDQLVDELQAARDAMRAQASGSTSFDGDPFEPDPVQGPATARAEPTRN